MKNQTTVYYPSYYKDFHCIADKCTHSCCVGWKIQVDYKTLQNYKKLKRDEILRHIKDGEITLTDDDRCPFLMQNGLCKIISSLGEGCISEICREHPRFYNGVCGRIECGIGASCEEACRIILSSDGYCDMYPSLTEEKIPAYESDFDTVSHRAYLYSVISDKTLSYTEKIALIKEKYTLTNPIHSPSKWMDILSELEYLDVSHKGTFSVGRSPANDAAAKLCERFLAYLIFRHVSIAENHLNLCARLGFCILICSVLEDFLAEEHAFAETVEFVRTLSEEIEYSEENTSSLIFEFESFLD